MVISKIIKVLKYHRQLRAAVSTQLSILEQDNLFALGGLTSSEESCVCRLAQRVTQDTAVQNPIVIIEFGTLFGLTTNLLADTVSETTKIITVDNFCWNPFGLTSDMHESFTRRILQHGIKSNRVQLAVSDSQTFRTNYAGSIPQMVFFDADHSYDAVRDEINWAKRIGVPLISGHDYGNPRFGVTRAVDEAFPKGVEKCGMVWWWQREQ